MSIVNDRLDAAFTVLVGRLHRANRITEFAFDDRVDVFVLPKLTEQAVQTRMRSQLGRRLALG
ncbi:MAG: hypothetical protein KatS3mg052_2152 [Candidatus Roseilinea sp.]|nr:MAG: hypothetical protein KatS3mg052_2152 [Candidatus Roseilinea sp.]